MSHTSDLGLNNNQKNEQVKPKVSRRKRRRKTRAEIHEKQFSMSQKTNSQNQPNAVGIFLGSSTMDYDSHHQLTGDMEMEI